jgi:hypothetical protein
MITFGLLSPHISLGKENNIGRVTCIVYIKALDWESNK